MSKGYEKWSIEKFVNALHVEPGLDLASRYSFDEFINTEINREGALVKRKGCRRVISFAATTTVENLMAADVDGIRTILTSEKDSTLSDPTRFVIGVYALVGNGLGSGAYISTIGRYRRAGTQPEIYSDRGWRFVRYRNMVFAASGTAQNIKVEGTGEKVHTGNVRFQWSHDATVPTFLEDWGVDSISDLLAQDPSLTRPTIHVQSFTAEVLRSHYYWVSVGHDLMGSARMSYQTPVSTAIVSSSVGEFTPGVYNYYLSYVRSDTLAESQPYHLEVNVAKSGDTVEILDIPTHPDATVDTVRIYRTVDPTQPTVRFIAQIPNGTSSFTDRGYDPGVGAEELQFRSRPATAEAIAVHNGRIYLSTADEMGATVWRTEEGMPENVLSDVDFFVVDTGGASNVTGFASTGMENEFEQFAGSLLVFTPTQVYVWQDGLRPLTQNVGCISPKTIQSYLGRVFWLGNDGTVYATDGSRVQRISEPGDWSNGNIRTRLIGTAQQNIVSAAAGVAHYKYYLSIQDARGNDTVYAFDIRRGLWYEFRYPFKVTAFSTYVSPHGQEYLYAGSSGGKVFLIEVGDRDETELGVVQKIESTAKLNPNAFGNPNRRKRVRWFHATASTPDALTLKTYIDKKTAPQQTTTVVGATATKWASGWKWGDGTKWASLDSVRGLRYPLNVGHHCRMIQLELSGKDHFDWRSVLLEFQRDEAL